MSTSNDEIHNLHEALDSGDDEKALGIYRLLDVKGGLSGLGPQTLAALALPLKRASMELEAAHLLRSAAKKSQNPTDASNYLFHAACLLFGPAFRPEMGLSMARDLATMEQTEPAAQKAQELIAMHDAGDLLGLSKLLKDNGVTPPPAWNEVKYGNQEQGSSRFKAQVATSTTSRLLSIAFFLCLAAWLLGGHMEDRLEGVDRTYPALHAEPKQVKIDKPKPIRLRRGNMNVTLSPLFEYHICGLVVSVNTYATLGMRYQDLFERDLCMVWGSNVSSGFYRAPGTSFEHHGNVCYSRWTGPLSLNGRQLSNNHIFAIDDSLMDELSSIGNGDQICIDGKLVDVAAVPLKAKPGLLPGVSRLHTSTTRTDKGMGACEILLVENLSVLARANSVWRIVASAGFWLALALFVAITIRFALKR